MISFSKIANEEVYTVRDVSKLLRVSKAFVYKLLQTGEMSGYRVGSSWRIPISSVEEWFNKQNGGDTNAE